jgi:hypothetical protein
LIIDISSDLSSNIVTADKRKRGHSAESVTPGMRHKFVRPLRLSASGYSHQQNQDRKTRTRCETRLVTPLQKYLASRLEPAKSRGLPSRNGAGSNGQFEFRMDRIMNSGQHKPSAVGTHVNTAGTF